MSYQAPSDSITWGFPVYILRGGYLFVWVYGDGINLTVTHNRECSFVFKMDNETIRLTSVEVTCRRHIQLSPTKVLNILSNAFNFIGHSRRTFIDLCNQWLARQVAWLQIGIDCAPHQVNPLDFRGWAGTGRPTGRVIQAESPTAR